MDSNLSIARDGMSGFSSETTASPSLSVQIGSDTDVGGGTENQDDFFVILVGSGSETITIMCVLDGHGRDVGKVAANAGKDALIAFFKSNFENLRNKPYDTLVEAHEVAHQHIKEAFKGSLGEKGLEVKEAEGGFLLKRKVEAVNSNWGCVHGGSSCSIVALVGSKLYVASVGDSSGILCTDKGVLNTSQIHALGDAATGSRNEDSMDVEGGSIRGRNPTAVAATNTDTLVVTAEHSPESTSEFIRLREARPRANDANNPALVVVYDSPTQDKTLCPPVFSLDAAGNPTVTNNGRYYKNVRKEWASLVSTPPHAQFQDALAFTRSLGDLHLSTYGVTHLPEVFCVDLSTIFTGNQPKSEAGMKKGTRGGGVASSDMTQLLCVVLATDGVWDNWLYSDVQKFVMDSSCIQAVYEGSDGSKRVAQSFMQRNAVYARRNFGKQADNATSIVCYLTCDGNLFKGDPGVCTGCPTQTNP